MTSVIQAFLTGCGVAMGFIAVCLAIGLLIFICAFVYSWNVRRKSIKQHLKRVKSWGPGPYSFLERIKRNRCPDCNSIRPLLYLEGTMYGASCRVKCRDCGNEFSIGPLDENGGLSKVSFAERVTVQPGVTK